MKKENIWDLLGGEEEPLPLEVQPLVTVVIPTRNSAAEIGFTLESLLTQDYPKLEIIVVDACSADRTQEIVKSFKTEKIRLISVSQYALSEMWNRGIMAGKGDYMSFLEPGTSFLFPDALKHMMRLVREADRPLLAYSSFLKRGRKGENRLILNPLSADLLAKGIVPTSFEACLFSIEAFREAGNFSTEYTLQGGFEFLSRLSKLRGNNIFAVTTRVVTDVPIRMKKKREGWLKTKENWRAIKRHFGRLKALQYLLTRGAA